MKHEIEVLVDYVEGKLNICDFREEFLNNHKLKQLLAQKVVIARYKSYNYNVYDYLCRQLNPQTNHWNNIYSRYVVWVNLKTFLSYNNIPFKDYTKYDEDYDFLLEIQPSWLDISDDQGIFDKIIAEMPKDLSKTKRIQWGKNKLKELFKYDKTYPRWIQDPEWPIVDGKPLVFARQERAGKDDERTYYYFYDPETGNQTIITQIY